MNRAFVLVFDGDTKTGEANGQFLTGLSTVSGIVTISAGGTNSQAETASTVEGIAISTGGAAAESAEGRGIIDLMHPTAAEPMNPVVGAGHAQEAYDDVAGAISVVSSSGGGGTGSGGGAGNTTAGRKK